MLILFCAKPTTDFRNWSTYRHCLQMSIFKTSLFGTLCKSLKPETYDENNVRLIAKSVWLLKLQGKKYLHAQPCLRWLCWYLVLAGASLSIVFSSKLVIIEFVLQFLYCFQYQHMNCLLQSVSFSPNCGRVVCFFTAKAVRTVWDVHKIKQAPCPVCHWHGFLSSVLVFISETFFSSLPDFATWDSWRGQLEENILLSNSIP